MEIITQTLSDKEIEEGLTLFAKYIKKVGYTHADPLRENCYISSSFITGVYFPNTVFNTDQKHPSYNITSVSKVNGVLGVVYSLKESVKESVKEKATEKARFLLNDYLFLFYSFDELLYSYEFKQIKRAICERLQHYEQELNALNDIKRLYKKDGEPFAVLQKNFNKNISFERSLFTGSVSCVKFWGYRDYIYLYRTDENRKAHAEPNADEVSELLNAYKNNLIERINTNKNTLKTLERDYTRFEKAVKTLKEFKQSVNNWGDYSKVLNTMI